MRIDELLTQRRDQILQIAAKRGARKVRVFGSAARGGTDEKSDVDILVDMEPGRSLRDLGGLWWELNELLGVKVDLVTENGLREGIRDQVLREAVPL